MNVRTMRVGLLALLASTGALASTSDSDRAHFEMAELRNSIELSRLQHGTYPEDPWLDERRVPGIGTPRDPWGNRLKLVVPGVHNPRSVDVISAGPDGLFDTADDVGNWPARLSVQSCPRSHWVCLKQALRAQTHPPPSF